jgi:hypothetical protein
MDCIIGISLTRNGLILSGREGSIGWLNGYLVGKYELTIERMGTQMDKRLLTSPVNWQPSSVNPVTRTS